MLNERVTFEVRDGPDGRYLIASGEIDMASGPIFAVAIARLLAASGEVTVDMSDVTYMDSTGLHVLCTAASRGSVRLLDVSRPVRRIIEIAGLEDTLLIESTTQPG